MSSCSTSVSPTSLTSNSSGSLSFSINNTSPTNIDWVKITSPSSNFTISSGESGGWSAEVSGSAVIFTLGSQDPGTTATYTVNVTTGAETAAASWSVVVSDSGDGSAPTTCSGDTGVAISSGTSTTSSTTTPTPTPVPKDTTAPTVSLSANLSRPYVSSPTLSGTASDSGGVASVEYSTDGEGSWIPAALKGKGEKEATFSFSLGTLDDGNYTFLIRAKDSAGNVSESKEYTLIIDRLPPQVGTTIFSTGAQIISPTKKGAIVTVTGLEQKVTLSAIGGPITLEVLANLKSQNSNVKSTSEISKLFKFEKNAESRLWSGNIKFDSPGLYDLTTKSIDGAKNETIQSLTEVVVLDAGKVSYLGKPVIGAEISVHVFEPTLGGYILWDGAAYGQPNPQKTNENGNYSLFLPAGKYYLEAKFGLIKLRSQIFELDNSSLVNANLSGSILSIPLIANEIKVKPTIGLPEDLKVEEKLVGQDFPDEEIASGEKQVVSVLATWLPDTAQQIQILEDLPDDVKTTVLVPQESKATVEIYKKRGRYSLEMLADPDGKLVEPLALRFLPTHFFLDENAKIKMIRFGVLNKEELLENAR